MCLSFRTSLWSTSYRAESGVLPLAIFANHGRIGLGKHPSGRSATVPTRNVNLTDELDRFVLAKGKSGRYENASEAVRGPINEADASGIARDKVFARVRKTLQLPTTPR